MTGPDDYTAVVDNNIFTNLMTEQNLRGAPRPRPSVRLPFHEQLGVHAQPENFTQHGEWDDSGARDR